MAEVFSVRAALPSDRVRLQELWLELIDYHRALDPNYPTVSHLREVVLSEIDEATRSFRFRLLVAECAGRIVGFALAEIQRERPRPAWIHELYVELPKRRRGVARLLVDATLDWFGSELSERVYVRVESANQDGLAFWEAHDFKERARVLERIR